MPAVHSILSTLTTLLALMIPCVAGGIDFAREIQPILSENCYHCHGPDEKARKGKLRLDTKDGMFRTQDDVTVVTPGHSNQSELIARIFSTDEEEVMPTPKSKRVLTQKQKDLLKQWVEEGATWTGHWAYTSPQRPAVPEIKDAKYTIRNPIDALVAAKLQEE